MGRPRKPIALKVAAGTYRADRDGPLTEAVRATGEPRPLDDLGEDALAFWAAVVPGLVASGVAAECDGPALSMMCQWWARYQRYSKALDAMTPRAKDAYKLNVMAGIAWSNFDKIASRFGMTPADRAKLRLPPPAAPPDELERFLEKRQFFSDGGRA